MFIKKLLQLAVIFQFEDSDVGVDEIYNTVEIETSDTGGYKTESTVSKNDNIMTSDQQATSDQTPSVTASVTPSVTINDSVNNQGIKNILFTICIFMVSHDH